MLDDTWSAKDTNALKLLMFSEQGMAGNLCQPKDQKRNFKNILSWLLEILCILSSKFKILRISQDKRKKIA